jgi:hypothetical protein
MHTIVSHVALIGVSSDIQAHSIRKVQKIRDMKNIESTTPETISMIHIPRTRSLKISILKPLTIKISERDQELRNTYIKLKLRYQDRKPEMIEISRILMVRS